MVYRSSRIWRIKVSDYGQSKSQIWVNRIPDFPEALNMTMREVLVSMGAARIRTPRSFGHHLLRSQILRVSHSETNDSK